MPAPQPPVTAVIVGAGHRAMLYASYAKQHPEELRIVGAADPTEHRRRDARAEFGFPAENCFDSAEALARRGRIADAAINGTMDHQHVPTSLPLLAAGYDLLLEKPFATNEKEMWQLVADFVRFLRGEPRSLSCTSLDDSVSGHLMGFRADRSREEASVMEIPAQQSV